MKNHNKVIGFVLYIVFMCLSVTACSPQYIEVAEIEVAEIKIPLDIVELNFSSRNISDISAFYQLSALRRLDVRNNPIEPEDIIALQSAIPNCEILWSIPLNETSYDNTTTEIDFSNAAQINIQELMQTINYFSNLEEIQLINSQITVSEYVQIKEAFPDIYFPLKVDVCGMWFDADKTALEISSNTTIDEDMLINVLPYFSALTTVNFGSQILSKSLMKRLLNTYPRIYFEWSAELGNKAYYSDVTDIDISSYIVDDLESFKEQLQYLISIKYIDMCDCGLTNEQMEELQTAYPNIKFVWKLQVGSWELRTDVKAFSTGHHGKFEGGRFTGGNYLLSRTDLVQLKYCTDLIALDIGHQKRIVDFSFLENLPNLRILIVALTKMTDLSVLSSLKNLEYLEIFRNGLTDISPLMELPNLKYLNCSANYFTDIDTLSKMKQLERLWMVFNYLSDEEIAQLREILPDCEIVVEAFGPTSGGWRGEDNEVYIEMREIFGLPPMFSK